jgi:hypothetical protein
MFIFIDIKNPVSRKILFDNKSDDDESEILNDGKSVVLFSLFFSILQKVNIHYTLND